MEKEELKNILARLKPELGAELDTEPSPPPAAAPEPTPADGEPWVMPEWMKEHLLRASGQRPR